MKTLTFNIENFLVIKKAEIKLNGITVITGENASNKNAISKFLYYLFKVSNEYEGMCYENLDEKIERLTTEIDSIYSQLTNVESNTLFSPQPYLVTDKPKPRLVNSETTQMIELSVEEKINHKVQNLYEKIKELTAKPDLEQDILKILMNFKSDLTDSIQKTKAFIQKRSACFMTEILNEVFNTYKSPNVFTIFEDNIPVISQNDNEVNKTTSVQNVAYIGSPMVWEVDNQLKYDYWKDAKTSHSRELFQSKFDVNLEAQAKPTKSTDFYNKIGVDFSEEEFIYTKEDGTQFNLLKCVTGIKSFAIVRMMLRNGYLNKNSLLIIDEPESYLYTQWIFEYAHLIVLLNKYIGVRFLITSNIPDMISAIKFISEKEEMLDCLNYYMAERSEPSWMYEYTDLGYDINPIFKFFNLPLERFYKKFIDEGL